MKVFRLQYLCWLGNPLGNHNGRTGGKESETDSGRRESPELSEHYVSCIEFEYVFRV